MNILTTFITKLNLIKKMVFDDGYFIKSCFTNKEQTMYLLLLQTFPQYLIFPKTMLYNVLDCEYDNSNEFEGYVRDICVDFVICDAESNALAVIEINDNHTDFKNKIKTKALKTAQIPLFRLDQDIIYNINKLKELI